MPATTDFGYSLTDGSAFGVTTFAAAQTAASAGDTLVANASDAYKSPYWHVAITISKDIILLGAGTLRVGWGTDLTTAIAVSSECRIKNLLLTGSYGFSIAVTRAFAGSNLVTIENCVFTGGRQGVYVTSCTNTGTVNVINCLFVGAFASQISSPPTNSAGTAVNVVNCTITGSSGVGHILAQSTAGIGVYNVACVGWCTYGVFFSNAGGGFTGTVNAATDTSAPGAGAIHLHDSDPKFWRDQSSNFNPLDYRPTKASCLYNAGSDTTAFTNDLDILGNARHATTPTIGCFEAWDLPVVPAAAVIKKDDVTGRAMEFSGATVTGTYEAAAVQAATPTDFSLPSGADGLTHQLLFTSAETNPTGYVYLAADDSLIATGLNGEKIRGLANNTSYKLKVTASGKTLSEYAASAATSATLVANYSAGAGNIRDGSADRVDGTVVSGTAGDLSINVKIPAPAPVQLAGTETTLYECPASYNASVKILRLCNCHTAALTVTIYKVKVGDSAADDVTQAKTISLGAAGTDTSIYNDGPYTLGAGDKLTGLASTANKITATVECFEVTAT